MVVKHCFVCVCVFACTPCMKHSVVRHCFVCAFACMPCVKHSVVRHCFVCAFAWTPCVKHSVVKHCFVCVFACTPCMKHLVVKHCFACVFACTLCMKHSVVKHCFVCMCMAATWSTPFSFFYALVVWKYITCLPDQFTWIWSQEPHWNLWASHIHRHQLNTYNFEIKPRPLT